MPFFLLFSIYSLSAVAQDAQPRQAAFKKGTYLKVNPSTILNELDIYLEQDISRKLSLELGITGIYTDYPDYVFFKRIDLGREKPGISTEQFVEGRGLGFRVGMKWYLIRQASAFNARGTYFEPVLFYKKVFYPKEEVTLNNTIYKNSGDKSIYGIQFLLGRQITKGKWILDPYLGIGVRSKVYNFVKHSASGANINADHGEVVNVLPSLHLGIKVGLGL
ncbi:hypothetical protein EGT74_07550 [Chitinophaga lutea]|uniref:DUF3575 domain-containing protein n=1 Tax=Chitinophaga lutea TaxID=2488634 RepID=A0A3N4PXD6_9BACT|nr:hypothetical protein EGT74_07550 [Chitinophaga lutea]